MLEGANYVISIFYDAKKILPSSNNLPLSYTAFLTNSSKAIKGLAHSIPLSNSGAFLKLRRDNIIPLDNASKISIPLRKHVKKQENSASSTWKISQNV